MGEFAVDGRVRRPGAGLASHLRGAVMAVLVVGCWGCLVTDKITFPTDPDIPPMILDAPGTNTPIGWTLWVNKATTPEVRLPVRVRDQNLTQPLEAHWRVLTAGNDSPPFESKPVPLGQLLRDFEVVVQSGMLHTGECHRVELAVSGNFFPNRNTPAFFDAAPIEEDVAHASWSVWEGRGEAQATAEEKAKLVDTCNAIEALLMPAMPAMSTQGTTP